MILRRQGSQILRFCRRLFPDPSFTQNIFREHVFRLKSQQGGNLPTTDCIDSPVQDTAAAEPADQHDECPFFIQPVHIMPTKPIKWQSQFLMTGDAEDGRHWQFGCSH